MSTGTPSRLVLVQTRPPTRSRASSTTTERPAWLSRRAAVRPANPAPTIQTSASLVAAPAIVTMALLRRVDGNMRAARM
jgi:hypothetical protein